MINFSQINGIMTLVLEPGLMVVVSMKKPAIRIFKDYLRSNMYQVSEINNNVITITLLEFIYIFGRYLESDDKFTELFDHVDILLVDDYGQPQRQFIIG